MENSLNAGGGAKFEEVKTMFNAKVSYASCLGLSLVISAQLLKYVFEDKVAEKSIKTCFGIQGHLRSLNYREPMYDFLLVINSNLGPVLHRY